MCNIQGYIGTGLVSDTTKKLIELKIKVLICQGDERGGDGVGFVNNDKFIKSATKYTGERGVNFIQNFDISVENTNEDLFWLCHNRAKSVGVSKDENAHPFEYVIGDVKMHFVHNGTIKNVKEIENQYEQIIGNNNFETDSELIGYLIASGVDLNDLFKMYEGFGTFVWKYTNEHCFYVFKGGSHDIVKGEKTLKEERPLHIVKDDNGYYISSLWEQLKSVSNETIYTISLNKIIKIDPTKKDAMSFSAVSINRDIEYYSYVYSGYYAKNNHKQANHSLSIVNRNESKIDLFNSKGNENLRKGLVYFKGGLYYYLGVLLHGSYVLDSIGNFVDRADGSNYYFYEGNLVKDKLTFERCTSQGDVFLTDFHPATFVRIGYTYYQNNQPIYATVCIIPLFSNIRYNLVYGTLDNITYIPANNLNIQNIYGKMKFNDTANYNEIMKTNFIKFNECLEHYKKFNEYTSLKNTTLAYYDFLDIYFGGTREQLILNKVVETYNIMFETTCKTIFQCFKDFTQSGEYVNDDIQEEFYEYIDSQNLISQ